MDTSLTLQYLIIAAIVFFAGFSFYKIIRKNFAPKKFKKSKPGCDADCGCS